MKQGKYFLRGVLGLFLLAVLSYFGYAIYDGLKDPLTTVTALQYEYDESASVSGFVVRDEVQLTSPYAVTIPTREEGARLAVGQTVAVGYENADAQARQSEIAALQQQIAQLTYACQSLNAVTLESTISQQLISYQIQIAKGSVESGSENAAALKGYVLQSGTDEQTLGTLQDRLATLRSNLSALTTESASGTTELTVPRAGYFSGSADGYESILTPDMLSAMTLSDYRALQALEVPTDVYGKLILSDVWYYTAVITDAQAEGLEVGDSVTLRFAKTTYDTVPMTITSIGESENGSCLLVLSANRYLQNVTMLREQTATLTFRSCTGLWVPKNAIRVISGSPGVYVLEGAVARFKPIEVLCDAGENYIVKLDESSTENLWVSDEIIVDCRDVFDGKVVYQ